MKHFGSFLFYFERMCVTSGREDFLTNLYFVTTVDMRLKLLPLLVKTFILKLFLTSCVLIWNA